MPDTEHYIDAQGKYLGGWSSGSASIPEKAYKVVKQPSDSKLVWDFELACWVHDVKIVKMAKKEARAKHFHNINYVTETAASLYPKRSFTFGVLDNVKWYADAGLLDLVLEVGIEYYYDALGFSTGRTVTRTWYKNDGTPHPDTKITQKDYTINPQEQLDESIRRRTNNIRQANLALIGLVPGLTQADPAIAERTALDIKNDGVAFYEMYEHEYAVYISLGSTKLEEVVKTETTPGFDWMNADASLLGIPGVLDVRDFIIYQLSGGARNKNGAI